MVSAPEVQPKWGRAYELRVMSLRWVRSRSDGGLYAKCAEDSFWTGTPSLFHARFVAFAVKGPGLFGNVLLNGMHALVVDGPDFRFLTFCLFFVTVVTT